MPFDRMPELTSDPVLNRLRTARAFLAQGKGYWCKYMQSRGGASCALGALARTKQGIYSMTHEMHCAQNEASAVVISAMTSAERDRATKNYPALLNGQPHFNAWLTQFNNHPDTTHADVLALFDRAIAMREQELAVYA